MRCCQVSAPAHSTTFNASATVLRAQPARAAIPHRKESSNQTGYYGSPRGAPVRPPGKARVISGPGRWLRALQARAKAAMRQSLGSRALDVLCVLVEGTCVLSVTSWAYGMCSKVRRIEATLRVNVQLTSGETGAHLWSDLFDEEISELAAGQEHIVTRMRSELGISMSRSRRRAASASGRPTPTRSISFCGRALWKTSHQTFNELRSKGTLRAGAGARPVRRHSLWSESLFIWWIDARRADAGAISTPCIVLRNFLPRNARLPLRQSGCLDPVPWRGVGVWNS
jgi:hypothetical protein